MTPPRRPTTLAKLRALAGCRAVLRDAELEERPAEELAALSRLVAEAEAGLWDGGEVDAPSLTFRRAVRGRGYFARGAMDAWRLMAARFRGDPRPYVVSSAVYDRLAAHVGMAPESRNLQRRAVLRAGMLPEQARLLDEHPRRDHVPDYDFGDGRRWEGGSLVPRSSAVDIDAERDRFMESGRALSHVHLAPGPPILMDLP